MLDVNREFIVPLLAEDVADCKMCPYSELWNGPCRGEGDVRNYGSGPLFPICCDWNSKDVVGSIHFDNDGNIIHISQKKVI